MNENNETVPSKSQEEQKETAQVPSAPDSLRIRCDEWTPEEKKARSKRLLELFNEAQILARQFPDEEGNE